MLSIYEYFVFVKELGEARGEGLKLCIIMFCVLINNHAEYTLLLYKGDIMQLSSAIVYF